MVTYCYKDSDRLWHIVTDSDIYGEKNPKMALISDYLAAALSPDASADRCTGYNHGHIGSNQMNQNVEPKTFFQRGKSHYLAEIRECWVSGRKCCGYLIQQQLFEPSTTTI